MSRISNLWKSVAALSVLAVSFSATALSGVDGDADEVPIEERQCIDKSHTPNTTPSVCTVTTKKSDDCAINQRIVTEVKCSDKVVTYPDDACEGETFPCSPPQISADALKSVKTKGVPSLAVGDCVFLNPVPNCTCAAGDEQTFTFGRKICK